MDVVVGEAFALVRAVIVLVPAAACVWAGVRHVVDPGGLGVALRQPPILRRALTTAAARNVSRAWGVVEIGTGMAVYMMLLGPFSTQARLGVFVWLTTMHAGFVLWIAALWRGVSGATCGCGAHNEPADGPALLRACLFGMCAAVALLMLLADQQPIMLPYGWMATLMAATLALLLWILPDSMRAAKEMQ